MKHIYKKTTYCLLIIGAMFLSSCFQDLGQNPPFDYPEQPTPPPLGSDGQIFYMSFDEDLEEYQSLMEATVVGTPTFTEGKVGRAYTGAANSYLAFNTVNMAAPLSTEMTFSFWYNVNGNPDRAGILVIGPPTEGAGSGAQNNRTSGIRIFREAAGGMQRVKANIGSGTADPWLDGGTAADIDPGVDEWIHVALVLRANGADFYLNGEVVSTATFSGISWAGCDIISIGSGAPRFTEWNHLSDHSLIDELRIFNRALTSEDIQDKIENAG